MKKIIILSLCALLLFSCKYKYGKVIGVSKKSDLKNTENFDDLLKGDRYVRVKLKDTVVNAVDIESRAIVGEEVKISNSFNNSVYLIER